MNDRQREQARIRQARRRARLKEEGASVTVTLTKQEEAMLQELCRVRRPGRIGRWLHPVRTGGAGPRRNRGSAGNAGP